MTGAKRPLGWWFRVRSYRNGHPDSSYERGNRNTERNLTVRARPHVNKTSNNTAVPIDEVCPPSVEEVYVVRREKVIRRWKCGGHRNRWVNDVGRGTRTGVFQTINCEGVGRSAYGTINWEARSIQSRLATSPEYWHDRVDVRIRD